MAKTTAQWYEIFKSWMPEWVFETEEYSRADFRGMAAVFSESETVLDNHFKETFICQSEGDFLDEHGTERNVYRNPGETDAAFCVRVQTIANTTSNPALEAAINAILAIGHCCVIDNEVYQPFFDREAFYDRSYYVTQYIKNFFTVFLNPQISASLEYFFAREDFFDREAFLSSDPPVELDYIYDAIVSLVNKNKALGTMYSVIVTESPLPC